jgi:hypothetical protein
MNSVVEYLTYITGIKFMWSIALGNYTFELFHSAFLFLSKQNRPHRFKGFLKYIFAHTSLGSVMLRKANHRDLFCIIIAYGLYIINQALLKPFCTGILSLFITGYFNDLLAPIMLLGYLNLSFSAKETRLKISNFITILLVSLIWGICWELFAPIFNPIAVRDIWDIVCYCLSGCVYYLIMKNSKRKNTCLNIAEQYDIVQ